MKQGIGWSAAILAVIVATIGVTSGNNAKSGSESGAPQEKAVQAPETGQPEGSDFSRGPCLEIESHLKAFLDISRSTVIAPGSCFKARGGKKKGTPDIQPKAEEAEFLARAANLRFMIAMLPDPSHSHFPLQFDRMAEAIHQGASDESYVYDSSWFPWETGSSNYSQIADQDEADSRKGDQEAQPGIMLFRRSLRAGQSDSCANAPGPPYCGGLVVFVVGEEPTNGIHRTQFRNAAAWIAKLQGKQGSDGVLPSRILGPSFSGSIPSLASLIHDLRTSSDEKIQVYSGNVSGPRALEWFQSAVDPGVAFASFQLSDDVLLNQFCAYLRRSKFHLSRLAIISEDQTAYGSEVVSHYDSLASCNSEIGHRPLRLFYPRDISELRAAYQKQSIFSSRASSQTDASQRTLSADVADPQGRQHDVIKTYGRDQTALSQEAVMQQIVSELRVHQSQYIVLRSSNALDQIFLSHYLRLSYSQGRIVILGADQLLRRESGAARLSGIMTLSTYPLLPWEPHWTQPSQQSNQRFLHSHRVFAQHGAEGEYVAVRALLHFPVVVEAGQRCEDAVTHLQKAGYTYNGNPNFDSEQLCDGTNSPLKFTQPSGDQARGLVTLELRRERDPSETEVSAVRVGKDLKKNLTLPIPAFSGFAPTHPELVIPDYAAPFWVVDSKAQVTYPEELTVWLSVLGRNDFWPLAALNSASVKDESLGKQRTDSFGHDLGRALVSLFRLFGQQAYQDETRWYQMPLGMRVALAVLVIWAGFHFVCCRFPSVTTKPRHRTYFVYVEGNRGPYLCLLVMASITISTAATVLAWGYGAMSPDGEPVTSPTIWGWVIPFTWTIALLSLVINLWQQIPGGVGQAGTERCSQSMLSGKLICQALAWSIGGSLLAYLALYFSTERLQLVATRIPAYWRSMHLTDGVSPVIPLLALIGGMYLWIWYSLQGLALLGQDRPYLPPGDSLLITNTKPEDESKLNWLRMFSQEHAGEPVEKWCNTFPRRVLIAAAGLFVALAALTTFLVAADEVPLRSLGARSYGLLICLVVDGLMSIMLAKAWQLLKIWITLRNLLVHLDRLPLRRSMEAFQGVSWGSVWALSGNVLDMRYKLLTHESRCLTHLRNCLSEDNQRLTLFNCRSPHEQAAAVLIKNFQETQKAFASWYSRVYDKEKDWNQQELCNFQVELAKLAGQLMAQLLIPEWTEEKGELIEGDKSKDDKESPDEDLEGLTPVSMLPPCVRHAEAFVCYVYVGFIQNVMGRMRSLVMGMLWLYVATTIAMSSYPFDPRPAISGVMLLLLGALGTSVVFVYAQMHRDPILSLVTNTKPGELGADFWMKLIGFGAGPVLGLITTLFPEVTDFVFSWVQPGLSSIK
jgi:hypothetical protein